MPIELRASTAIPASVARREGGGGERRRGAARAGCRRRRSGAARLAAALTAGRARVLRSPLALARAAQSSRRSLEGRGAARARTPRGGGLAPSALLDVAWPGRHRLGGNRSHRRRDCDRDENADVRRVVISLGCVSRRRGCHGRRRRWARNGALGIMCLVRVRGVERVEHDVLVVSIDRLTHVLRAAARPAPDVRSYG